MTSGIVNIHGKEYQTVALRVQNFRQQYPDYGLRTRILDGGENVVVMVAEIWKDDFLLATGHAEEKRGSSQINKTSALENCETSAIGRALAALGFGGTEFASANEVQNAIHQQDGNGFISKDQADQINQLLKETSADVDMFLKYAKAETVDTITAAAFPACLSALKSKKQQMQREPGSDDS